MKIDMVLTAGNLNHHYLQLFPLIHKVWKKRFNLDCYCILISKDIPDYLNDLKEYIILFKPIERLNDIYVAQVIRLLYPALFPDKTVLITDLDILPVRLPIISKASLPPPSSSPLAPILVYLF